MKKNLFYFDLPDELIAQTPLARRSDSRLLHLDRKRGDIKDQVFGDLPALLKKNDLLIFNDTRVIPARLFGRKQTGGKVEILVERILDDQHCLAQIRSSKSPKSNTQILLDDSTILLVEGREGEFFRLQSPDESLPRILDRLGHMPLPPYIRRNDSSLDQERYQTVYASRSGAVAAPTAGLHFDQALLTELKEQSIKQARVTLHVGAGTFQPVREEHIENHKMHAEYLEVSETLCEAVEQTKAGGGRVIAVGTTSVRSLETAAAGGKLKPFAGDSRIFIYPGYDFRVVDGIITNFHLPESTLLMLVSAFAGIESIKTAYQHAIKTGYRFFSYGDAMLII